MKKMGLKKRMAILLILFAGGHYTARPEVIITGILDGTLTGGSPKVIELFVSGTENLGDYEIWRSLNGAPFGSGSGAIATMSGVYSNTFVYLVKTDHVTAFHEVFGNDGIFANVLPMGIVSGNGNDGFQVRLKEDSAVIDQVWLEDAADSYLDSYWYRNHGTGPDGGWLPSAWETPGNDALDGLDQEGLQAAVPFGTYSMAWRGLTTDWNDPANWSLGMAPSFQVNALISDTAANFPVITNPPENPAKCMNLTLTGPAGLTVLAGKALTIHGNLVIQAGAPGNEEYGLILDSELNQVQTGSLIILGEISGTAIIRRHLAKDNSWHFLSSPVAGQEFQPAFVPVPLDNSFDLYYWDENAEMSSGWINCRDENGLWNPQFGETFITGKGYLVAYSPSNPGPVNRTFTGTPTNGNMDIPLGHSANYWNLLGNPYTSALDWTSAGINKDLVAGNAMYIWDPALNDNLGGYRTHNGTTGVPEGSSPVIPAMQGFFVQSLDNGFINVYIAQDEPLVHGNQPYYKNAQELTAERIRFSISKGPFSDEILVCLDETATNSYDPHLDAEKLFHGHEGNPEIYSLADPGHKLCINILGNVPVSVPLAIAYTSNDTLDLTAFDFTELDLETGIFLEDKLANSWIDLREQPEYRFQHHLFHAEDRFVLHLMNTAGSENPAGNDDLRCWSSGNTVFISNPAYAKGKAEMISFDGKFLQRFDLKGGKSAITTGLPAGLYILRLLTPSGMSGRKIFIR